MMAQGVQQTPGATMIQQPGSKREDSASAILGQLREQLGEARAYWSHDDRSEYVRELTEVARTALFAAVSASQQGFSTKPGVSNTGSQQLKRFIDQELQPLQKVAQQNIG